LTFLFLLNVLNVVPSMLESKLNFNLGMLISCVYFPRNNLMEYDFSIRFVFYNAHMPMKYMC